MNALPNRVLEHLRSTFAENFIHRGELGASLVVWQNGEELLSLADGWTSRSKAQAWSEFTLVPVYSATKGPSAATLLYALENARLSPADLISQVWPEFPCPDANFGQLLNHQCGLSRLDSSADISNYEEAIAAIESTKPAWPLGTGHGYHPRTFGFLLDECARRMTGQRIGQIWNDQLRPKLNVEFWIGLPPELNARVATLYPGKLVKSSEPSPFAKAFGDPQSLTYQSFTSPQGLNAVSQMNDAGSRVLQLPAMGGIGTARALAQFYQALLKPGVFSERVLSWIAPRSVNGEDKVLLQPTSFSNGFMRDPIDQTGTKIRQTFGANNQAFGHPGAGGSLAFADPTTGVSFAYTMNQMELGVLPGPRCQRLVDCLS